VRARRVPSQLDIIHWKYLRTGHPAFVCFLTIYVRHVSYCRHDSAAEGGDKSPYHIQVATLILRSSCDLDRTYHWRSSRRQGYEQPWISHDQ